MLYGKIEVDERTCARRHKSKMVMNWSSGWNWISAEGKYLHVIKFDLVGKYHLRMVAGSIPDIMYPKLSEQVALT